MGSRDVGEPVGNSVGGTDGAMLKVGRIVGIEEPDGFHETDGIPLGFADGISEGT